MARAQNGDGAAYARLLRETTPYLRSLVTRWHRIPPDVEDAVQDVLMTVHQARRTYDPSRPFAPLLVAIARRRFFDRLRLQSRPNARETPLTAEHEAFAKASGTDAETEAFGLTAIVGRLPSKHPQAIEMLKFHELPLKEASRRSGMSIASLKVATHRALRASARC